MVDKLLVLSCFMLIMNKLFCNFAVIVISTKLKVFLRYVFRHNRLINIHILSLLIFASDIVYAQEEAAIRPIIEAGDLKKLVKADEYKEDADKLFEEASSLNMQVLSVQSDAELDEKAITKKSAQLESQAQQKQIQASALYEKCNEVKFVVYKSYLDAFWKKHTGEESDYINSKLLEEQANDVYFQATSYRIDAKKMDAGFAKVEKLSEANNLELEAIQKQLTALATYYSIEGTEPSPAPAEQFTPPVETVEIPAVEAQNNETIAVSEPQPPLEAPAQDVDQTIPSQVEVDQRMIDLYNSYVATGQFADTALSTGALAGLTSFDADRVLLLWHNYLYGTGTEEEVLMAAKTDSARKENETQPSASAGQNKAGTMEIGVVTDENRSTLIPADEEVIYRIQLAANRSQLSQRALSRMYYGNKTVEMINENGWYKYSVGDFDTYDEANKFRKSTGMRNVSVVAYRKGTRFTALPETAVTASATPVVPVGETRMPSGLVFRIQVAASRVQLTVSQLERIYTGAYPVEMIAEEGWYKYQFMGVRLYSDALQIIKNVNTRGVFIVAYEDGVKINLAEAVKKNKELERKVKTEGRKGQINDTEYHVQLAASRNPMKADELSMLYSGSEPVTVILEDGWYKYHIKTGNSPEIAEQQKQACGIANAFIVPYRRAAKITYYEAIQENK
jgi:hypothetical protein